MLVATPADPQLKRMQVPYSGSVPATYCFLSVWLFLRWLKERKDRVPTWKAGTKPPRAQYSEQCTAQHVTAAAAAISLQT